MSPTQELDKTHQEDKLIISDCLINEQLDIDTSSTTSAQEFDFPYSITPHLKEMRATIKDTKYAIDKIAVVGKHTHIVAQASVGKSLLTLKGIVEQVRSGEIQGKNVIYMTGDASFTDIVEKAELIKPLDMDQVYVDGFHDFKMRDDFYGIMSHLIKNDIATDKIIIVDVLRNVTSPMDKKEMQTYNESVNKFILSDGTVISCTHANKHLDKDDMPKHEGVSEVRDGCDCMFLATKVVDGDNACITLHRNKAKCVVAEKVYFKYPVSAQSYQELFDQTKVVSQEEADEANDESDNLGEKLKGKEYIDKACEIIQECEADGGNTRTNIRDKLSDATDLSRKKAEAILDTYTGESWECNKTGKNNAKTYTVLNKNEKRNFDFLNLDLPHEEDVLHPV